jgi:hypothetical protein
VSRKREAKVPRYWLPPAKRSQGLSALWLMELARKGDLSGDSSAFGHKETRGEGLGGFTLRMFVGRCTSTVELMEDCRSAGSI